MGYGGWMAAPAIVVEALPASYGDSLLVTCRLRRGVWRLLVDTGPDECWPMLKARLAEIPPDRAGRRHVDLFVVTHIDHDHIGGASALLRDRELGVTFGDIWFNAPKMPASRGVAEGQALGELLGAQDAALPWNRAWGGRHAVTSANAPFLELPSKAGAPKLTLLSPTPDRLAALFKVWAREVKRLAKPGPAAQIAQRSRAELDLAELANKTTATDRAPANGSSIALLLEHRGASVLLAADAHPTVLGPAIRALAAQRRLALPMQIDVFKLSHHGSRSNVTKDLLSAVQAKHYIVSTNGAIFGHPDDEAVARVIRCGGRDRQIWFNSRTPKTSKWGSPALQDEHGYRANFPSAGSQSVVLPLKSRVD